MKAQACAERTSDVALTFWWLMGLELLLTASLQHRVLILSLPVNVTGIEKGDREGAEREVESREMETTNSG